MPARIQTTSSSRQAVRRLGAADPALAAVIRRVGPLRMGRTDYMTAFQAIMRSIIYQQLSGRAAKSIHRRVLTLFPNRYASPGAMARIGESRLLEAGMSRAKTRAVKDLAGKFNRGLIPNARGLSRMSDQQVIECLGRVVGVGVWTAQMLLIFHMGRPDVLPASDLGIRKGFQRVYGLRGLPAAARVIQRGERWRPYRSIASWYLWRANELE